MSASNPCTCKGTLKERRKNWYVWRRNYNVSSFEYPKNGKHYSEYSSIACSGKGCLMTRRSKEKFVDNLPDKELIRN